MVASLIYDKQQIACTSVQREYLNTFLIYELVLQFYQFSASVFRKADLLSTLV